MKNRIMKLIEEYKEYSRKNGFSLNPNKKIVEGVIKGLLENEKRYGKRYCPCRRIKGIPKEDEKIICPCVYHKKEIKKQGHCHCLLFVDKKYKKT